jgi:hypothetical protein
LLPEIQAGLSGIRQGQSRLDRKNASIFIIEKDLSPFYPPDHNMMNDTWRV